MSGYGPAGWSYSLNFTSSLIQRMPPPARTGGNRGVVLAGWAVLRLSLGIIYGMIFEMVGYAILAQTSYNGYDFQPTHRRPHAQVFIGSLGGLAMGIVLVLYDFAVAKARALADYEPLPPPGRPVIPIDRQVPNIISTRNQAAVRIFLWPFFAAISGVVGVSLWHLSINTQPQPNSGYRGGTGAVVQVVGSCIVVSAPSLLQLLTIVAAGNRPPK